MFEVAGEPVLWIVAQAVGLALLAALVAGGAAFAFRLYTDEDIPEGASLILALGAVGLALNTRNVLVQFVGDGAYGLTVTGASVDIAIIVLAAFAASGGRLLGNRFATSDRFTPAALGRGLQSPIVRATGRRTVVTLPETIEDIDGYDPVADETKRTLEGKALDFPPRLTVDALERKLVDRLKEEGDVGYVDLDTDESGSITHLGLGRRPAGLGPTLPPGSVAVAVRCDPAFSASPGDSIQLWRSPATRTATDPPESDESTRSDESAGAAGVDPTTAASAPPDGVSSGSSGATSQGPGEDTVDSQPIEPQRPVRVCTGELRAVVDTVATIIVDENAAPSIDPTVTYRVVTLPSEPRPDREFAGMLRRADETMQAIELPAESPLVGTSLRALDVTVIAVRDTAGDLETLPPRDRELSAGDTVIAIGRLPDLRALASAARGQVVGSVEDETVDGIADVVGHSE